jgi:hypothetical protein
LEVGTFVPAFADDLSVLVDVAHDAVGFVLENLYEKVTKGSISINGKR